MSLEFGFEIDTKVEDEGEWKSFPELQKDFCVKLRSVRSDYYRKLQNRKASRSRHIARLSPIKQAEESERISKELIAEACIMDWKGLKDKDGNEVPYSVEQALTFMTERKYYLFQQVIIGAANQIGIIEEEIEDDGQGK